jgi:glycosyltransferase involved in cell wall biosynthesis
MVPKTLEWQAMKIVLATGIYPPEVGGPATYVRHLAEELSRKGMDVTVVSYGRTSDLGPRTSENSEVLRPTSESLPWKVVHVSRNGGTLLRWWRYARALRKHAADADVIYAFSSVSIGIPLWMSMLKKPKRVLRLGGDFFWERYTDFGGKLPLRAWYALRPQVNQAMQWILGRFDFVVFSTQFQRELYERSYGRLPSHAVLENALPEGEETLHLNDDPFRILFLGRFVRFKNIPALLTAVSTLPHVALTVVGDGPAGGKILQLASKLALGGRISFLPPVHGEEKKELLKNHQLLILPSLTEVSPHAALEARAMGLPVLLTEETGLSDELTSGMVLRPLLTSADITRAILEVQQNYEEVAKAAIVKPLHRSWEQVAQEHVELFRRL